MKKTRKYYVLSLRMTGSYVELDTNDIANTVDSVEEATPFPTVSEVFALIDRRARRFQGADIGFDLHRVTAEIQETPRIITVAAV